MQKSILASRYIKALLLAVNDKAQTVETLNTLSDFIDVVESTTQLGVLLNSPLVSTEQKKNLITPLLTKYNNPLLTRFILLLVQKKREGLLKSIKKLIPSLIDKENNVLNVKVETPIEFSEEEKNKIQSTLSEKFGKTIHPEFVISHEILGGFKATVGNLIYDGTLENSLLKMKSAQKQK